MAEKIARYYVKENNPDGGHFPGVGLRDLTEEEWDALPAGVQESVDASSMYRKTKPPGHVAAPAYESGVPSKASGGPVSNKMPVIVGEPGPEIFVPSTEGSVSPAPKEGGK